MEFSNHHQSNLWRLLAIVQLTMPLNRKFNLIEKMKPIILSILLVFAIITCFAQDICRPYVPEQKGTKWEITNYSGKGKVTGRTTYELVDVVIDGNSTTYTINSKSFDQKDKEVFASTFEAYCKDGKFEFDMAMKMDGNSMKSYKDMEFDVDASTFEIPSMDASAGTALDDGSLIVKIGSGSVPVFKMTIEVTDRAVEAREKRETPAGSYDCIRLTQTVSTKLVVNIQGSSKEWYAEGVGMVRSESYSKKGKLMGYSELTKFEKG